MGWLQITTFVLMESFETILSRFNFEIELQVDGQSKNECCLIWSVGKGEKTCKTLSLGNKGSQVIPLLLHLQLISMF
jgi:hypothetical protein